MHVLAVAARKGGVGKTTISANLAVQADQSGVGRVVIIDTDPQQSLADWWAARGEAAEGNISLVAAPLSRLAHTIRSLRESGTALVVIDTPPALNDAIAAVIRAADLVLIPTRPSPVDLRAIGGTLDLVEAAGTPALFVVNGGTRRARLTAEAAISLSQHGTVAPAILHHRVDFAAAMVSGQTVGELSAQSPSALEIACLWKYVNARLRKHVAGGLHGKEVGKPAGRRGSKAQASAVESGTG